MSKYISLKSEACEDRYHNRNIGLSWMFCQVCRSRQNRTVMSQI